MNPMTRTAMYVGVAVISVTLAIWKGLPTPEINPRDLANQGDAFFPEFSDPTIATGIRVVTYNNETAEVKPFEVSSQNGVWKIPSHYNYPADGKDQLTKTAASLVAVKRGAVAGESEVDYARLGVVDPLSDDKTKLKGRGDRLTLTAGSTTLLDLIIGNQVEDRQGFYYVRKPDEKITYITQLDLDLSTKFGDWIEPDLLQIDTTELRDIIIKDYNVDEASRRIKFNDVLELKRPDASTPWQLTGIDAEKESLKTATMNTMIQALDELKISGVRPKPKGLSADLKLTGSVSADMLTQIDLQSKGYYIARTPDGGAELFANEGDLAAITSEGVSYVLRFGEVFTGNEFEIEVGSAATAEEPKSEETDSTADSKPQSSSSDNGKQSRYLFVTVQFDPDALGPEPVPPTAPKEENPPATEPKADGEATTEPAAETPAAETPATEGAPSETTPTDDPKQAYEAALKKYEEDRKAYEEKVVAGEKRVEELNQRFADWYYVIDAASFDKLRKTRADLVEAKEAEPEDDAPNPPTLTPPGTSPAEPAATPDQPKMETPAVEPAAPATTPASASEKPAPTEPPADKPAAEKPATPEKPADSADTPEKPAAEKPAEPAAETPPPAATDAKPEAAESAPPSPAPSPEPTPAPEPAPEPTPAEDAKPEGTAEEPEPVSESEKSTN